MLQLGTTLRMSNVTRLTPWWLGVDDRTVVGQLLATRGRIGACRVHNRRQATRVRTHPGSVEAACSPTLASNPSAGGRSPIASGTFPEGTPASRSDSRLRISSLSTRTDGSPEGQRSPQARFRRPLGHLDGSTTGSRPKQSGRRAYGPPAGGCRGRGRRIAASARGWRPLHRQSRLPPGVAVTRDPPRVASLSSRIDRSERDCRGARSTQQGDWTLDPRPQREPIQPRRVQDPDCSSDVRSISASSKSPSRSGSLTERRRP
jgi:hypothetical protein